MPLTVRPGVILYAVFIAVIAPITAIGFAHHANHAFAQGDACPTSADFRCRLSVSLIMTRGC